MKVSLLYVDDCPNWRLAEERLTEALEITGHAHQRVEHVVVANDEQAQALDFIGSPTLLIDDEDPFRSDEARAAGLSCRVYRSASGLTGSPSIEDIVAALSTRA